MRAIWNLHYESLNDYLDEDKCSEVEHLNRKTKFQNKGLFLYSQPQIVVNSTLHEIFMNLEHV